jgi:hypothetical protein
MPTVDCLLHWAPGLLHRSAIRSSTGRWERLYTHEPSVSFEWHLQAPSFSARNSAPTINPALLQCKGRGLSLIRWLKMTSNRAIKIRFTPCKAVFAASCLAQARNLTLRIHLFFRSELGRALIFEFDQYVWIWEGNLAHNLALAADRRNRLHRDSELKEQGSAWRRYYALPPATWAASGRGQRSMRAPPFTSHWEIRNDDVRVTRSIS